MHERSVIAIIPARGGSKGVPSKNVTAVGGVPLVGRAIRAAQDSGLIDAVYVSTDDNQIAATALLYGADVIERPAALSSDTATSESALLHGLIELEARAVLPEVTVFIQATSPFIDPKALANAVSRVRAGEADSVFSAVRSHAFLWRIDEGSAVGINHDLRIRQRRQDRQLEFQETGAFYVMRTGEFRLSGHRFFGVVGVEEVSLDSAIEIDTPEDLAVAQALAGKPSTRKVVGVMALAMDFDGVHTDDQVHLSQDGVESVRLSRSDGMGIERLRRAGIPMIILSKEKVPIVELRAAKLGIPAKHGIEDKVSELRAWARQQGLDCANIAYVGNDVNDLECMAAVGWPVAVADAHPQVRSAARLVLSRPGGSGAVRELAELILDQLPS